MSVSATLTMDVSISSMIAAAITVIVMISLRSPCSAMAVPFSGLVLFGGPHGRVHAHARAQRMIGVGGLGENDLHRDALGDLDEIPRRVVGRQEREARPGGPRDGLDLSVEYDAWVGVDLELDILAGL